MKKQIALFLAAGSLLFLSACANDTASNNAAARQATTHAMNFVINGDDTDLSALTDQSPEEIQKGMKEGLIKAQTDLLGGTGAVAAMSLDGVSAQTILEDYAQKAVEALTKIESYDITSVVSADNYKEVSISFRPLIGVEEHLTGNARLEALKNIELRLAPTVITVTLQLEKDGDSIKFTKADFQHFAVEAFV